MVVFVRKSAYELIKGEWLGQIDRATLLSYYRFRLFVNADVSDVQRSAVDVVDVEPHLDSGVE